MKIGILNLPIDNNYGGNLQRFALIKTLQNMGHEPEHIQIRFAPYTQPLPRNPLVYLKRLIRKVIIDHNQFIFVEKHNYNRYLKNLDVVTPFYNKFVPHTIPCYSIDDIRNLANYDFYIIGSDQVWRKTIAAKYLRVFFGEILPDKVKRIAYAVSFGTEKNELTESEISYYGNFYQKFSAVSVREESGLGLLKDYGWLKPEALHLLDPTFLLKKEDYQELSKFRTDCDVNNRLFCYILDLSKDKLKIINRISEKRKISPFVVSLNSKISIEEWLKAFEVADYVITDSYHGLVFSIIFNKPYYLIRNSFRGNARFESLLHTLNLTEDGSEVEWEEVNNIIEEYRNKSIFFLAQQLMEIQTKNNESYIS